MMKRTIILFALWLILPTGAYTQPKALEAPLPEVRNLIYMIGDGMGLAHLSMLEIEGGYAPTAFNRAQGVALISTYSANNRVTDSAAAGTALSSGEKTGNGMLGQDMQGREMRSMMERAVQKGMATGIVVTCYLQHATPAAFYAHTGRRTENNQITEDMLASGIDVLMGGGEKYFDKASAALFGERNVYYDEFRLRGYTVVDALSAADTIRSGKLLAVMAEGDLPEAPARGDYLPRATAKALEILAANAAESRNGFMLMVEGSQIDHASHANDSSRILAEMRDFEQAVAVAMDFADRTPGTLVVVTADHETGGLAIPSTHPDFTRSESGLTYVFGTGSHTAIRVPVYLYGVGADRIAGMMDNTQLAQRIMALMGLK